MEVLTMRSIVETAQELHDALIWDERDDGAKFVRLRGGEEDWMIGACGAAHDDMFPDDWRYEFIKEAAGLLAECPAHAEEGELRDYLEQGFDSDVMYADLLRWLGSDLGRASYVEDLVEDFVDAGGRDYDSFRLFEAIGGGQLAEKQETGMLLLDYLIRFCDEGEDDEEEE